MKTIRRGVFETNSSSTHSIVICSDEDYQAWTEDKVLYDEYNDQFIPLESLLQELRADGEEGTDEELIALIRDNKYDYPTFYEDFGDGYDTFDVNYTTKSGEVIHAVGYYGYDY